MIYIRADMNDVIATGHIMRCIAIAEAAKKIGENVVFLIADAQATMLLQERGLRYIVLDTVWNDMESELITIEKVIRDEGIETLLVDSYQVTAGYLKRLSELVKVAYIDDLNVFNYPVDILICYATYWKKFDYSRNSEKTKLFLGTKYTPLRQEFCNCKKRKIKPQVENLLLFSGGSDYYNALELILGEINIDKYSRIDVICGIYNENYVLLKEKYKEKQNINIFKSVQNVKDYMMNADMVITAGGTTLYELCAVGTPAISYSLADNQLENVKGFQEDELIDWAGDVRFDNVAQNVNRYLEKYHYNQKLRQKRSMEMQKKVDGKGAERIVEILKAQ